MRTIVVFQAPGDARSLPTLAYCELSDLASPPHRGDHKILEGALYEVHDVTECLGVKTADGRLRSGNHRLLEILGVYFTEQEALSCFAMLHNVGSGDAPSVSAGGIITAGGAQLIGDFDNLLFVRMKLLSPAKKLGTLLAAAGSVTASSTAIGPTTPEEYGEHITR